MESKKGHIYRQWIVALIGNLVVMSYGLQSAWMSPMSKLFRSENTPTDRPLTDFEISWIASAFCLTAAIATIPFALIADVFGRKASLMTIISFQVMSWILLLCTTSFWGLLIARVASGAAAGGCFNTVPMYTKEISQASMKGTLGSLLIMLQNIGLMSMYAMGVYLDYTLLTIAALIVPVLNLLLLCTCPESPAFLVKHARDDEALKVLSYLRGLDEDSKELKTELEILKNENVNLANAKQLSYCDIMKNPLYRKIYMVIGVVALFQANNGNLVMLSYASSIMVDAGVTYSPDLQTMTFPAIMIVGSFISMALVQTTGRKVIYVTTMALSSLAMGVLATFLLMQSMGMSTPGWIPVVTIMISAFAYAAGICPMTYLLMAETFNIQLRSKLIGVIVSTGWGTSFIQLLCFSSISNHYGLHTCFYIYCVINFVGTVFALIFMPETKGKTVEEIEKHFQK